MCRAVEPDLHPDHFNRSPGGRKDKDVADIEIFLQGVGIPQVSIIMVPEDGTVRDIVGAAKTQGLRVDGVGDLLVFLEDHDEPLALDARLDTADIRAYRRVHVHTCRKVEVTVNYDKDQKSRPFSPARTVGAVEEWAEHEFKLEDADAVEFALQLYGTSERPTENTHIGSLLTSGSCALCFDLVAKQRVEG